MKIKKIILEKWIDPALITHHLTKKFGDKGLAWLDSDAKENGEWSIIGIKPKKIIQSRDINNLDKTNNPFNNLRNIEKLNFVGLQNCGHLPHVDLPSLSSKIIQDYFLE